MDSLEERRKLWAELSTSPVWPRYRAGGRALNGIVPEDVREQYRRLGLPWEDSEDATISRNTFFMWMLHRHGGRIFAFLRDVMQVTGDEAEEETLQFSTNPGPPDPENAVLVVDLGSINTTIGWAGEQRPVARIATAVYDKKPIVQGFIRDYDLLEEHFKAIFQTVKTDPALYSLMVTVAPKTAPAQKAKLAKFLFDKFEVPSVYIVSSAYAVLCSTEQLSGLVLNVGGGVTHAVPIYETVVLQHAVMRLDLAGEDITQALVKPLTEKGHMLSNEDVDAIKESIGRIEMDFNKAVEDAKAMGKPVATAFLGDGRQFPVGDEIFRCPEYLFTPSLIGKSTGGVAELVKKAINQCDLDVRKALWENVLLAGGSTMFPGFAERLAEELKKIAPDNTTPVINAAPNRKINTWLGASALAMGAEFYDQLVTVEEFVEAGEDVFLAKCLQ